MPVHSVILLTRHKTNSCRWIMNRRSSIPRLILLFFYSNIFLPLRKMECIILKYALKTWTSHLLWFFYALSPSSMCHNPLFHYTLLAAFQLCFLGCVKGPQEPLVVWLHRSCFHREIISFSPLVPHHLTLYEPPPSSIFSSQLDGVLHNLGCSFQTSQLSAGGWTGDPGILSSSPVVFLVFPCSENISVWYLWEDSTLSMCLGLLAPPCTLQLLMGCCFSQLWVFEIFLAKYVVRKIMGVDMEKFFKIKSKCVVLQCFPLFFSSHRLNSS